MNTWYRETNYEVAKEKMLENLKKLRGDIDNLIKEEEKTMIEAGFYLERRNLYENIRVIFISTYIASSM